MRHIGKGLDRYVAECGSTHPGVGVIFGANPAVRLKNCDVRARTIFNVRPSPKILRLLFSKWPQKEAPEGGVALGMRSRLDPLDSSMEWQNCRLLTTTGREKGGTAEGGGLIH
jgi:hypothetical protein